MRLSHYRPLQLYHRTTADTSPTWVQRCKISVPQLQRVRSKSNRFLEIRLLLWNSFFKFNRIVFHRTLRETSCIIPKSNYNIERAFTSSEAISAGRCTFFPAFHSYRFLRSAAEKVQLAFETAHLQRYSSPSGRALTISSAQCLVPLLRKINKKKWKKRHVKVSSYEWRGRRWILLSSSVMAPINGQRAIIVFQNLDMFENKKLQSSPVWLTEVSMNLGVKWDFWKYNFQLLLFARGR